MRWDSPVMRTGATPEQAYIVAADLEGLGGYDPINRKPFAVHLHVGGRIDFRFFNHEMTADQARELGTLLLEAAHTWDQLKSQVLPVSFNP